MTDLEHQRIRAIRPSATTSASEDGRWLDKWVAQASWTVRFLSRTVELSQRADEHTEVCR